MVNQNLLKKVLLFVLVLVTLLSFHLALSLRREIFNDQISLDYLALTQPLQPASGVNSLTNINRTSRPTDPYDDWALQSIGAPATRDYLSRHPSTPIKVAIISSGINPDHEELAGLNLYMNTENSFCDLHPTSDDDGHGTASASLISALWQNNLGTYGVGNFPMFICRLTTNTPSQFVAPLNHAVEWGAKVVLINYENIILPVNSPLYVAIQEAASAGVAVVIPAGNSYNSTLVNDIAGHPNVFTVGAHDHLGNRRPYSDYEASPNFKQIDFLTPGGEVVTPWWKHDGQNNLYRWFTGTSSAGPLAAGALATIFTLNPNLTLTEAKTILCFGASDHDLDLSNGDEDGCGNLNLARALAHPLLALGGEESLPPYFTQVPLDWRPLTSGIPYQFDFNVLGEGIGTTYTLINGPLGATFNPNSGVFVYTPPANSLAQVSSLNIRANNPRGEAYYYGKLLVGGETTLPFNDNLENKDLRQFRPWWRMSNNSSGRMRIDSKDSLALTTSPAYLELSRWANNAFDNGLVAADLVLKIDHPTANITIDFDYLVPNTGHVANLLLPSGPGVLDLNLPVNWGDGMAFSLDGLTWYRGADLSASTANAWISVTKNLNDLLSQFGLTLGNRLYLRFANLAQENSAGSNSDRLLIDNVTVNYLP